MNQGGMLFVNFHANSEGMQRVFIIVILFFVGVHCIDAQQWRELEHHAYSEGEKLDFTVYYHSLMTGRVKAGEASLELKNNGYVKNNREVYHIVGKGWSTGFFNLFFKVDDRFDSFMDKQSLCSHQFNRRTREGGYKKDDIVLFNHDSLVAISLKDTTQITPYMQDVLSAFYYARTVDISSATIGQYFPVDFFLDDSVYVSVVEYLGKEVVKTKFGKFNCVAFKPMVATGEVFDNPYPMTVWISDDKNRLPILAKSEVVVGSIKVELSGYENLKNPFTSRIK